MFISVLYLRFTASLCGGLQEETGSGTRELEGKSTSRPCTNVASQLLERIKHCTVNVGGAQNISLEFHKCNMQNHEFQMLSLLRVI